MRVSPRDIHINDPSFSDDLYSFKGKLDRDYGVTKHFNMDDATVFTVSHELHRLHRAALAPYFSRHMLLSPAKDGVVQSKVEILCARFEQARDTHEAIDLNLAFKCLATDVITEYALGKSYDLLHTPDFSVKWFEAQRDTGRFTLFAKHFPWLIPLLRRLPVSFVASLHTEMGQALTKAKVALLQVCDTLGILLNIHRPSKTKFGRL